MILKIDEKVKAASLGTVEQLMVTKENLGRETHKDKDFNEVVNSVCQVRGQENKRVLWQTCFRVAKGSCWCGRNLVQRDESSPSQIHPAEDP